MNAENKNMHIKFHSQNSVTLPIFTEVFKNDSFVTSVYFKQTVLHNMLVIQDNFLLS